MNEKFLKLNQVFPNFLQSGIFNALNKYDVPWKNDNKSRLLDITYYVHRSGSKYISPLVEYYVNADGEILPENVDLIAQTIFVIYGKNWNELYKTMFYEYNPLENYRMVESETSTSSNSGSQNENSSNNSSLNSTLTKDGTDVLSITKNKNLTNNDEKTNETTMKHTGTDSNVSSTENSATNTNSVYGFNSSNSVNSDVVNGSGSSNGTNTKTLDLTDTENIIDKVKTTTTETETGSENETISSTDETVETQTSSIINSISNTGSSENERELTRSGNIGVTTSQQMIESERNLWMWKFYDIVFKDVDEMLTLQIY